MTYEETEIVADAGTRLRIIADGLIGNAQLIETMHIADGFTLPESYRAFARMVDEVRVRLCALPLEPEGEAT